MSSSAIAVRGTASQSDVQDYDAIVKVMNRYNEGVRTGSSAMMKPAFHEAATLFGYIEGKLLAGSIQMLFDWVDGNGPSNDIQSRIVSVAVHQTIAVVGEASLVPSHQLVSNGLAQLLFGFASQPVLMIGKDRIDNGANHRRSTDCWAVPVPDRYCDLVELGNLIGRQQHADRGRRFRGRPGGTRHHKANRHDNSGCAVVANSRSPHQSTTALFHLQRAFRVLRARAHFLRSARLLLWIGDG